MRRKGLLKMGFLVNPVAGMGGRVGLKGTDNVASRAAAMGAKPISPIKAKEFLTRLKKLELADRISLISCPGIMGEEEIREVKLQAAILPMKLGVKTTADDTKSAVRAMVEKSVDLIVFVGGDGTAKDILDALNGKTSAMVLGVPSGVKMYSGVFAASAQDAADVVSALIAGEAETMDFEVIDADEEAIRGDRFSTRLYGFLRGPFVRLRLLGSKQVSPETIDEHENQMAVAKFVVEEMAPKATYILGPGTTMKCIADLLGVEKTLLGVDVYREGKIIKDANEDKILQEVKDWDNTWIVLSPIGRQGILLGRGNQQISPQILRRVGKDRIIVAATKSKIQGIEGGILRIDTGDVEVDKMLRGYIRVSVDYREWRVMQII